MKKCSCFILLAFACFISNGQVMPVFQDVVTHFFSNYELPETDSYLKFQKKKEGWWVAQDHYASPGNYFNAQLLWSAKQGAFQKISYPESNPGTETVKNLVSDYMKLIDNDYEVYMFQRNKYYGYPAWAWDVITEKTVASKLSDTAWEGLGRAYANYASGFIAEQYGDLFINNDSDRIPLTPKGIISKSRIDKFIYYEEKAIEAYRQAFKINPAYETRVGNLEMKCANEYLFMYCDLMMAGDTSNAHRYALKATYPDSIKAKVTDYILTLPANSILVTTGDNATYPLLYLQEASHLRRDVIVLNYTLLGLRSYLSYLDKKYHHSLFSTPDSVYLKHNFEYFVYVNGSGNYIPPKTVSSFINELNAFDTANDILNYAYMGEKLKSFQVQEVYFSPDNIGLTGAGSGVQVQKTIKLNKYLFMNEFVMLDIINTNRNKRRVFFAYDEPLFEPIFKNVGVVYEVVPNE